jgi:hypothetical protein
MKKYFLLIFLSGIIFQSIAQKTDGNAKEIHVYLYSFENLTAQSQIDKLISDVLKIDGITEAKVNAKWEKSGGELIFKVEVVVTGNESVENNDFLSPVKQSLINNGLMPVDCKRRLSK